MENNANEEIKYYNLSIPQENIWLIEKLNENSNINNVCGTFFIKKALDLDILKKAINKIIENNDALRIRITMQDLNPVQYIHQYEYDDLPVYFLDEDNETKIKEILDTINLEHINILNNKLYDLRLIATPTSVCVCIKMHHIIADGWSMGQIFIENIQKYYTEIEENRVIDKKTSYLDYVKKSQNYKSSDKYLRDMEFWKKYVKNISSKNEFEIVKDKKNNRIIKTIDFNLQQKILSFCEKNNISEFAFFLGIISIYFSKIFNQKNIVIGTPFLNRQKSQKELEIMGMFVATLPISIQVKENLSFMELCKQISATNMACFKHSSFPYGEIQKEYMSLSGGNTNLYEIAFSYQVNNLEKNFDSEIYKTTWLPNHVQLTPLVISYVNHFGENELCYDYLLNLFSENDIDNLHERFLHIIKQVLRNNNCIIQNINILCDTDIALLQKFNNTGDIVLEDETIISRFQKIVQQNKSKVALKYNETEITYKQLDELSNAVANGIIKQKVRKGSPISLIFDKSIEMFVAMLGVMKAGCYYIPILPEEEQDRAEFIVKNSESELLITEEKYSTQIGNNIIENQVVINDLLNEDISMPNIHIKSTDLCYMIYTSGSTGTPKGVMLKHENVVSLITSLNQHKDLKFLPDDIAISLLKYSFDASTIDIYTCLLNGGKLVIVPKNIELDPNEVCKIIQQEKITRFFTVSKWIEQIQNISQKQKIDLSFIRLIGTGGEVLKPEKFKYLHKNYPNLKFYNTYGPTETTVMVTSHLMDDNDVSNNSSSIGKLIPFSRAIVMNHSTNEILPVNVKGELVIFEDNSSIHNISNGYFKLENRTKENFITFINPYTHKTVKGYKTGDFVKINKNLELDFYGRNDDFKKVNGGYLVSLIEVETRIQNILGTSFDISLVSIPIRNTNTIVLFIAKKSDSVNITVSDIKNVIDEHLTFYMRPKQIIELDNLPFTNNGKINKKLLEKQAIEYFDQKNDLLLPTNKTEQQIYDIVHGIVNFDFSITDDFEDDLGIDSLNIAILYAKLNNKKISIQDLYNYPTVKDLAYLIKKELASDEIITTNPTKILNASSQMDLEKILLTGTTGFVGVHLLKEFALSDTTKKIYCIVRQKLNLTSEDRFDEIIHTYFDEETCKLIKKKSVVLNGDLRKENLGLNESTYNRVFKDVKTIVNAAANVKHIGKYPISYVDNVETVNHLIKICIDFHISLAHISTLSLNGYSNKNVTEKFTENTLNINQTFNKNPYLMSKFEAEQSILKNILENALNAKIFRIGNIMPRISDNVFQINYNQNGFLLAINALSQLQMCTDETLQSKLCLTPVDDCCKAIYKILNSDYCNTIYHIENDKKIKISSILDILKERNIEFSTVSTKAFQKKLSNNYSIGNEYLKSTLDSNYNKYSNEITMEILDKLDFKWEPITKNYLENIINIAMKIK